MGGRCGRGCGGALWHALSMRYEGAWWW